ncbi:MAG: DUF4081 domain-containing protein, partial [Mycobacteriales bacterium]
MLTTAGVRPLGSHDLAAAHAILDADPVANVFVSSRLRAAGVEPRRLGAEVWGYFGTGPLESLCYAGANLIPV